MRADRYPNLQRALNEYLNEPHELRKYMTVEQLVDSLLKTLDIEIPKREKKDRKKVDKYFAKAESILTQKTFLSAE